MSFMEIRIDPALSRCQSMSAFNSWAKSLLLSRSSIMAHVIISKFGLPFLGICSKKR